MQQDVVLDVLAKERSTGSSLRAGLDDTLGPPGGAAEDGQIGVDLSGPEV